MKRRKIVVHSTLLDSNESAFLAQEAERIENEIYEVEYPEYTATSWIPVSAEAGPGAESIAYYQMDKVGMAKIIASYSNDFPRVDILGKKFSQVIHSIGDSYGWNLQELRTAAMAKRPLTSMKANAAREAFERLVNQIAWFGDTEADLKGLIYHPNVTRGAADTGDWLNPATTTAQKIADVNAAINDIKALTNKVEFADTLIMADTRFTHLATTPFSNDGNLTILDFLKRAHSGVTFAGIPELDSLPTKPSDGSAGPVNVMIAYRRNPSRLKLHIPQDFETFPPQQKGLEFEVPCHGRIGGVTVYRPLSINVVEGI